MTARRLSPLAEIGSVDGRPGTNRPGLGAAEQRALELVAEWMHQEGLAVSWDAVGNLYGRLAGATPTRARCGPARTWTRCPTAGRSTAHSAS